MENSDSDDDNRGLHNYANNPNLQFSTDRPLLNVSRDPMLSDTRDPGNDYSLTDITAHTPTQEVVVASTSNMDEAQKLRLEIEKIQAKNKELQRKRDQQQRESELAELKRQKEEAERENAALEAAVVPNQNGAVQKENLPNDGNQQKETDQRNGNNPPNAGANVRHALFNVPESDEDEAYYTPRNNPPRRKNKHRSRSPLRRNPDEPTEMDKFTEAIAKLQTQPKKVVLKQKPPKFNGTAEDARLWLKEYKLTAELNNWTNIEKALYLPTVLTGPAKVWYDGRYDGETPGWEDFEKRFTDTYQPVGYMEKKLAEFYSRDQTPEESPIEYLDQMVKLRNELEPKPTDRGVASRVKRGLAKRYAGLVVNIEDLDDLRSTLNKMAEVYEDKDKSKKQTTKSTETTTRRPPPPAQGFKQSARPVVSNNPNREFQITCYNCDRVGHYSKFCPEPKDHNKISQNFNNLQNARNQPPAETSNRNNWRQQNRSNNNNQSNHGYNLRNPPTNPAPSAPSVNPPPTAPHAMFRRTRQPTEVEMRAKADKAWEGMKFCTLPSTEIVIGGSKVDALVDTGGAYSLISADLAIHLEVRVEKADLLLKGIGDSSIRVLGKLTDIPVLFDKYVVKMPFYVMSSLMPHVILGIDFVQATNLVIHKENQRIQYYVKLTKDGHSPCSDTEHEEAQRNGIIPPYKLRHATNAEKKFLRNGRGTYVRSKSQEEREQYVQNCLNPSNPARRPEPTNYVGTALKTSKYIPKWSPRFNKLDGMIRNSYPLPLEQQRPMPANYNDHWQMRPQRDPHSPWIEEGEWWSTECERMDRQAKEDAELDQVWREIRRREQRQQESDLIDLTDDTPTPSPSARARAFGPRPAYGCSRVFVQIPAFTDQKIKIAVPNYISGLKMVRANQPALGPDLIIPTGIVDVRSAYVEIIVRNNSAQEYTLNPEADIAIFEEIKGDLIEIRHRETTPADINCFNQRYEDIPGLAPSAPPASPPPAPEIASITEYLHNFHIGEQIEPEQRQRLVDLLVEYRDRFVLEGDQLGQIRIEQHHIDTGDHPPVSSAPYRVSAYERKAIEEQVQQMLEQGIIEPIISPWASPVVIVSKRDNTLRFCVDYRKVNQITKADRYPLPRLDDALDVLGKSDIYSTLDACSAYWQIKMSPDSVEKTTFICHLGTFCFKYMPFGLKCAPSTMSRVMAKIFEGENGKNCIIYLDDCICMSKGFDQHLVNLRVLLNRMRQYDLKLKPSKCYFAQKSVSFLGHLISEEGIRPDPDRTSSIKNFKYRRQSKKSEVSSASVGSTGDSSKTFQ